ncbi:GAF domain-containing SpoIIE family protein phosphatase [Occallatibacter riparius]|uniref:SpoIIE family protein phosphatase n=1 Tax=Occallatibacter riparius TaxID=1002689 RepID=A0A9J7BTM1_9BACT|nr:GAF domain-containing SpoIIE family protein phosphatase [Occallatibacter riparius]UWZ86243.1 SpoIIE family protein phosphatase [Occallatibacter riparius]
MATVTVGTPAVQPFPARIRDACEFTQLLIKVQRATHRIASTLDLDTLLGRVVHDIAGTVGNVEVCLWLREEESGDMVLQEVCGCTHYQKGHHHRLGPMQGMVGHCASIRRTHYAPDVLQDPYYIACEPETRSEAAIPLLVAGEISGVLSVSHQDFDAFSEDQITVLEALAGHIAIALENARAFRSEREQRARLQKESEDARAIQQALFLKPTPVVPGFEFDTAWCPAGSTAGDWFDFIDLGNQRYGIALGDVSGKGMSAALLMSATRALLRSIAPLHASPAPTLAQLNRSLMEDFPIGKFVTMIYGVLDAGTRMLTLASAGHPRPMVIANGACSFLDVETGLPLGLGTSAYPERTIAMPAETRLLLYSDGITEASNDADEEFGPARLLEHFQLPDACVDGLIDEVRRFGPLRERQDDATAVLIRSL